VYVIVHHLRQHLPQRARALHGVQGDVALLRPAQALAAGEKGVGRTSVGVSLIAQVDCVVCQRQELANG
jgi:hypothetical protein